MAKIKKKTAIMCCCALLVIILVLAVALYFTVLWPRPPRVVATVVDTQLSAFSVLPPELNLSLAVEVTVHNPNHAPFWHGEVVTAVTYHGASVGRSAVPAGEVGARSTKTVGARVQVDAVKVIMSKFYVVEVVDGALAFKTATAVAGEAVVLRSFTVSAAAEVACSVILYPFKRESSSHCNSTVHVD